MMECPRCGGTGKIHFMFRENEKPTGERTDACTLCADTGQVKVVLPDGYGKGKVILDPSLYVDPEDEWESPMHGDAWCQACLDAYNALPEENAYITVHLKNMEGFCCLSCLERMIGDRYLLRFGIP